MDIKDVLWEINHRGPVTMNYTTDDGEKLPIWYLDDYHPYRQQGVINWRFDQASSVMLRFKRGEGEAIGYYLLKILGKFGRKKCYRELIEDADVRFAAVPGHNADSSNSSVHKLARMLSAYYGREDFSQCLQRKHNVAKLSSGGNRSMMVHCRSMVVDEGLDLSGKTIFLLDDIVTTGNSLVAGQKVLLEAGAAKVYLLAMGRTVLEPETPFANKWEREHPVSMDDIIIVTDERYKHRQRFTSWE